MGDKTRGLYGKFLVRRLDGTSRRGGKHHRCAYFVLDLVHDKFAWPAIDAYARACEKDFPKLAHDLRGSKVLGAARPISARLSAETEGRRA